MGLGHCEKSHVGKESFFSSLDAVAQRRQHALVPHRGFYPRPFSSVVLCALFSACAHCRRFALALPLCTTRSSTFLPPVPRRCFAPSASRVLMLLGRCGTMKALTPASVHPRCRSPRLLHHTFPSFRLQPRGLPEHRLPPRQRVQRVSDFATYEQARRSSPPNRVRSPTDQQFVSGCSPPRLAATQLPSTSEFVAYSVTDFHRDDMAPSRAHSFPRTRESRFIQPTSATLDAGWSLS